MSDTTFTVTDATFAEAIGSSTPTIVDFWAEWCGPCKMIAPILEEIASDHAGQIRVAKLNVDENPQSATDQNVMSLPTLIIYKDGVAKKRLVGARPKKAIMSEVEEFIG